MVKKRFEHIDFLRAVSIIGVIAIHTLSYQLNNPAYYFLWNYFNFVVVSFVFCSGYVLTAGYKDGFQTGLHIFNWIKKRAIKLIVPFYIYLITHYLLWIIFPQFFSGLGLQKNLNFILRSITLIGGVDLNWLPLLFLQMTILFPLLMIAMRKKKLLYIYIAFSVLITIMFTIMGFPRSHYRAVMWISWSVTLLIAMYVYSKDISDKNNFMTMKRYFAGAVFSAVSFGLLMYMHTLNNRSFQLVNYKYPPGFYYILYGLSISFLILIVGKYILSKSDSIRASSIFLSVNSYTLYFVHYIMLDFIITLTRKNMFWSHPFIQFIFILSLSLMGCMAINLLTKKLKPADHRKSLSTAGRL